MDKPYIEKRQEVDSVRVKKRGGRAEVQGFCTGKAAEKKKMQQQGGRKLLLDYHLDSEGPSDEDVCNVCLGRACVRSRPIEPRVAAGPPMCQFFVVAKDFGAWPAYILALLYLERIIEVVTLGVPYISASSRPSFVDSLPEGFYISRFREPGRAEADFACFDATTVFRNIYILFSGSEIPIAAENQEIMDLVEPSTPLSPWLSEEDLKAYGDSYERTGFQTALQVTYRSESDNMGITDLIVKVPVLVVMGEKDYFLKFPGIEESINSGKVKEFASDLELVYLPEGTHFAQEQFPDQFNQLMLTFLKNTSDIY